ncbi:claudin-6-like [Tachyglossus aculeatus]|uniref:claudin-6-like n=1 Tax=Tachyglossus aculeatus TaxID=9261 RepID=UPI0018F415FF|nr:claudin-6-like [Tachyglossus aculeatus]
MVPRSTNSHFTCVDRGIGRCQTNLHFQGPQPTTADQDLAKLCQPSELVNSPQLGVAESPPPKGTSIGHWVHSSAEAAPEFIFLMPQSPSTEPPNPFAQICWADLLLGLLVYLAGAKCTTCVLDEAAKAQLVLTSGIVFLLSGLLVLIPVCWTAHAIIQDFYNPVVAEAQKWELGASLYLGWVAVALLLLGRGLLCCTCPLGSSRGVGRYVARYAASPSAPGASRGPCDYPAKNYI